MNNPIKVKPIQRDLLYTKIADAIMEYIKENDLKTGDRIPSERELAQEFNTSRNSVREALRVLENNGIIEVKMGKGAYITEKKAENSFYLKVWKVNYIELLEMKSVLEMHIIRELCGNMTQLQIDSLNEPMTAMERWVFSYSRRTINFTAVFVRFMGTAPWNRCLIILQKHWTITERV